MKPVSGAPDESIAQHNADGVAPASDRQHDKGTSGKSDLESLRLRLLQMELPPGVVRRVMLTMVDEQLEPQREALRKLYRSKPYWLISSPSGRELVKAKHEFEKVRTDQQAAAVGELGTMSDEEKEQSRMRFGVLTPELMKQCEAIRTKFRETRQADVASQGGLAFVSDQVKLGQSASAEFDEVRRVLKDDSVFEEYLLRVSPGATMIRRLAGDSDFSEKEFREIFRKFREMGGNIYSLDLVQRKLLDDAIASVRPASPAGEKGAQP
jgi:hypothetical protein